MRLRELKENDAQLDEILPALAAAGGALAKGATAVGKVAAKGAQAVGSAAVKGAKAVGGAIANKMLGADGEQDAAQQGGQQGAAQQGGPQPQGFMAGLKQGLTGQEDPAQHQKDVQAQKAEIQDAIKEKQAELQALQQQLAQTK